MKQNKETQEKINKRIAKREEKLHFYLSSGYLYYY